MCDAVWHAQSAALARAAEAPRRCVASMRSIVDASMVHHSETIDSIYPQGLRSRYA
jgi:hypothetical protein